MGSGAVSVALYLFLRNVHDVTIIARNRKRRNEIASVGIEVIDRVRGIEETVFPRVISVEDVLEGNVPRADVVFIAVKAYDLEGALEISRKIRGEPCIITLQNGIEPYERSLEVFGKRAVHGIVTFGAYRPSLNKVVIVSHGKIFIGSVFGRCPCVDKVLECLQSSGIDAIYVDNVRGWLWVKLLVNAAINPITSLLRAPNGIILMEPLRSLAMIIVEEGMEVAKKLGIELPEDPRSVTLRIAEETKENLSSMLQDIVSCRRTEIDYISGAIARYAEQLGIDAKLNKAMHALVKALELRCSSQE